MSRTSPSTRLLPLGAIAAGFGLSGAAWAQTPPADGVPPVLPVVRAQAAAESAGKDSLQATTTRIGKGKQELRDVPQSVTVVTERLIDDRNLDTLKEALKKTAGISFLAAEGGEEDIRLRGFSLQATGDIFVDGLRDPAFYDRDSFNWDRLEVLRGSASMLFGRGSTGGAVNQVSKQPLLFSPNEVAVTMTGTSALRATADLNQKTGDNAAFRVNAMAHAGEQNGVRVDKGGIAPAFRWGIGTANEFAVSLYHLENNNGIHYGLPWLEGRMLDTATDAYYGMDSDYAAGSASHGTATYTHRFADRSEWRTTLRLGRYERDQRASAVRLAPAALQPDGNAVTLANFGPATVLRRSGGNATQAKIQDLDNLALQSDIDRKFTAFGLKHSVQAGVDFVKDSFVGYQALNPASSAIVKASTTVGTPGDGARVDESLRLVRKNRDFESDATGLYAQDLLQLSPNWKVLGGLRWDRFEGRYRTYATATTATASEGQLTADRGRADALWSRRFGVLYQPTPLTSFHASFGTSFNTSGDAYQYDQPGTAVGPEKSRNIEIGAKIDSESGAATWRLALFHATKYNERNRDEASVNEVNYVLSGQRHAAGFEVDVAGRLTPQWEVYASYAWIPDARVDQASSVYGSLIGEAQGARPGLTPRHSGTVWSTWQLTPRLRVGGGLNLRSSDTPQQSSIRAPGFATADLMAEYDLGAVRFKLDLSNIADKLYADMLYRGHYIQGKGRTVQLTTAFKF